MKTDPALSVLKRVVGVELWSIQSENGVFFAYASNRGEAEKVYRRYLRRLRAGPFELRGLRTFRIVKVRTIN